MNGIPQTDSLLALVGAIPSGTEKGQPTTADASVLSGMFYNLLNQEMNPIVINQEAMTGLADNLVSNDTPTVSVDPIVSPLVGTPIDFFTAPALLSGQSQFPEIPGTIPSDMTNGLMGNIDNAKQIAKNPINLPSGNTPAINDTLLNPMNIIFPIDSNLMAGNDNLKDISSKINAAAIISKTEKSQIDPAISGSIKSMIFGSKPELVSDLANPLVSGEGTQDTMMRLNISKATPQLEFVSKGENQIINNSMSNLASALNIKEAEVINNKIIDGELVVEAGNQKGVFLLKPDAPEEKQSKGSSHGTSGKVESFIPGEKMVAPVEEAITTENIRAAGKSKSDNGGPAQESTNNLQGKVTTQVFGKAVATPDLTTGSAPKISVTGTAGSDNDAVSNLEASSVKFILPAEVGKSGIKGTQTVIIKMEPESLGNVRLTLTNNHDILSGRLQVENHSARAVVQANLDLLYDQLLRQGIRLDSFEVALNGGQAGYRFSQGKTAHDQKIRYEDRKNNGSEKQAASVTGPYSPDKMYIRATGVNWIV